MKKAPRIGFGIANFFVAATVAWAVFHGLPSRWWVIDFGGTVIIAMMAMSGALLLLDHELARRITRVAAGLALALGLSLFAALVTSASWLWGTYGQVGRGGASVFILVCVMVLPYLVVLPVAELLWVGPREPKS